MSSLNAVVSSDDVCLSSCRKQGEGLFVDFTDTLTQNNSHDKIALDCTRVPEALSVLFIIPRI